MRGTRIGKEVEISSPEDGNRPSFRNVVFSIVSRMDKVQEPSNPECYTPLSEPFRIGMNIVAQHSDHSRRQINEDSDCKDDLFSVLYVVISLRTVFQT
jgi:hypothetical protein